jgi:hypothetical protein
MTRDGRALPTRLESKKMQITTNKWSRKKSDKIFEGNDALCLDEPPADETEEQKKRVPFSQNVRYFQILLRYQYWRENIL